MWNVLSTRKKSKECTSLRDFLELDGASGVSALSAAQQQHLAACPECQRAVDDIFVTRTILRDLPRHAEVSAPWFAPRVMAAIAAKESELRQSLDAWAAVPRLAARLTWLSALALVVASTWLYQSPRPAPTAVNGNQASIESLFDSAQSGAPDDVLPTMESGHE
jgi:hypothetical protein